MSPSGQSKAGGPGPACEPPLHAQCDDLIASAGARYDALLRCTVGLALAHRELLSHYLCESEPEHGDCLGCIAKRALASLLPGVVAAMEESGPR